MARVVYGEWPPSKSDDPDFNVVRAGIPTHNGNKVCYHHLSAKGCPGGLEHCKRPNICHFIPKKAVMTDETLAALEHHFELLRQELQRGHGDTRSSVVSPSRRVPPSEDTPRLDTFPVVLCNNDQHYITSFVGVSKNLLKPQRSAVSP
jgi:hypothetical protein